MSVLIPHFLTVNISSFLLLQRTDISWFVKLVHHFVHGPTVCLLQSPDRNQHGLDDRQALFH
uniref:Uncharacterized protein n=1 Tax=Zea mays TaxID=4577 RepID=C4J7C1_MAIZE|nr:unknown [Zea mays]